MSYVRHNTGHYSEVLGFIEEVTRVWFCADNCTRCSRWPWTRRSIGGTWTDPEAHAPFSSQSSRPLGTWPCWEDVCRFGDLDGQSQLCSATRPLALWCVHSTVFLARKILGLLERIYGLYRFTRKLQTPQRVSSYHRTQKAADWMPTNFVLWSQTQTRPW